MGSRAVSVARMAGVLVGAAIIAWGAWIGKNHMVSQGASLFVIAFGGILATVFLAMEMERIDRVLAITEKGWVRRGYLQGMKRVMLVGELVMTGIAVGAGIVWLFGLKIPGM